MKKNNLVFTELSFKNRNNTIYITPWYRTKIDVLKKNNIKINTLEYQLLTPKQQKDAELFCKNKYFRYIKTFLNSKTVNNLWLIIQNVPNVEM